MTSRRAVQFVGITLMVIGAAVVTYGAMQALYANASQNWPQVTGTITSSEFIERQAETSDRVPLYDARIRYHYEVDGESYRSDRVAFGTYASSDATAAYDLVNRYPGGAPVTVYVDPADPSSAVLEPGVGTGIRVVIGVGAGITVIGLITTFAASRMQRSR